MPGAEANQMSARAAVELSLRTARRLLRTGGSTRMFLLLEITGDWADAEEMVKSWVPSIAESLTVSRIDCPLLTMTRDAVDLGRLAPRSLLLDSADTLPAFLHYVRDRSIREIAPVVIGYSLS
jgi:hypothetical protein